MFDPPQVLLLVVPRPIQSFRCCFATEHFYHFYTFHIKKFFKNSFTCFCFPRFFSPATWRRQWWGSAYSRCLGFALVTFLRIGIILMTWVEEIGVMIKSHIRLNDDFADSDD